MPSALQILDQYFPEMRWRCLSLAADLDRIERAQDGGQLLASDPRLSSLRDALKVLLQSEPGRAEKVQMIFSEKGTEEGTEASKHGGTKGG